jgi:hypothetical protein
MGDLPASRPATSSVGDSSSRPSTSARGDNNGSGNTATGHYLRSELLQARRSELLARNAAAFGDRVNRAHTLAAKVQVKPHPVPSPPSSSQATSRTARFNPSRIFHDQSPPRERGSTGLPSIPSVRRRHEEQEASKPQARSTTRYLWEKLPASARPNTGTLNEGAPMYSSFSKDTVFRGNLPRGALDLTNALSCGGSMAGTPRGVFGAKGAEKPLNRTLIR